MIRVLCLALLLGGCATTAPPQWVGGSLSSLDTDRTICEGEVAKAGINNTGGLMSGHGVVGDVMSQIKIDQQSKSIMLGCMAERGWKMQVPS